MSDSVFKSMPINSTVTKFGEKTLTQIDEELALLDYEGCECDVCRCRCGKVFTCEPHLKLRQERYRRILYLIRIALLK